MCVDPQMRGGVELVVRGLGMWRVRVYVGVTVGMGGDGVCGDKVGRKWEVWGVSEGVMSSTVKSARRMWVGGVAEGA